ncbi:MAG: substrate-binding domain-containing protein [Verrucomicrobiota bacterium]
MPPFIPPTLKKAELLKWFRRYQPDGVLTSDSPRIQEWFREEGVAIPQTLQLVSFCKLNQSEKGTSGIYQNYEAIGSAAVDLAIGQLNRNERGIPSDAKTVLVQGRWSPGKTLLERV